MTAEPDRDQARLVIGRQIRDWRLRRHLSQAGLARAVRVNQASISNYESGKRDPSIRTMIRIADVLGGRLDELLDEAAQRAVLDEAR